MIDLEVLSQTHNELFELKLKNITPEDSSNNLKDLFRFLKQFYASYSIDNIESDFKIILSDKDFGECGLDKKKSITSTIGNVHESVEFPAVIQLMSNNAVCIWNNFNMNFDMTNYDDVIVYEYTTISESISVGKNKVLAPASCTKSKSIFALATYLDLESALDNYYKDYAKYSVCKIMQEAWYDENRLLWKSSPESILRDSLWQFLRGALRNAGDILREQNVNEENPIDIKITWNNSIERALIEIKWLGTSVDDNGIKTCNHSNSRIKAGAKQLIDYIDTSYEQTPTAYFKGYLVVFDGRRRMVDTPDKLQKHTKEHSIYFKDIENREQIHQEFWDKKCIYKRFFLEPVIEKRKFSN